MKIIKTIITLCFILISFVCTPQQMQQKLAIKLDAIGNAKLTVSMTMNAQQWQMWLANVGNNPAVLKRELERSMPSYFLDDFKLDKNDMDRSFNLELNAYGICKINKRGVWMVETDQKNAQITELTDHKYMLVSNIGDKEGSIQQTYIIEFPTEAINIEIDKDAYGQTVFKFKMENTGTDINIPRWSGVFLLLTGAGIAGFKIFA